MDYGLWNIPARTDPHSYVTWHASLICDVTLPCVPWRIHMWHNSLIWDVTHSHVPTLAQSYAMYLRHDAFARDISSWQDVTYVWGMSHSDESCPIYESCHVRMNQMWHDSLARDAFAQDLTHWYVTYEWVMSRAYYLYVTWYGTWLIQIWPGSSICDMTRSYVPGLIHIAHDPFTWDLNHLYVTWNVTWSIQIWPDPSICDMTD